MTNPLQAPDLSRNAYRACKAELSPEENDRLSREEEARLIAQMDGAIEEAELAFNEATERAKAMPDEEGILRSTWTGPLEHQTAVIHNLMVRAGQNPDEIQTPSTAAKGESAIPDHARHSYRRGVSLLKRLKTAQDQRKKRHEKAAAP
jgi:hypothetical protein